MFVDVGGGWRMWGFKGGFKHFCDFSLKIASLRMNHYCNLKYLSEMGCRRNDENEKSGNLGRADGAGSVLGAFICATHATQV